MQIEGFRNPSRTGTDRTDRADGTRRSPDRDPVTSAGDGRTAASSDLVETEVSNFIDESVKGAIDQLEERMRSVTDRRRELLERADDPEAIRRAARAFLREDPLS